MTEVAGRIPDFFIVGYPKCGSTALYETLKRNPQVYMSNWKEPNFFASDLYVAPDPGRAVPRPETLEQYRALFAAAREDQLVGDASIRYILSPTAAARIADAQPGARIIVLVREPASYLRSLHMQMLQSRAEVEPSLRRALELEPERRQGRLPTWIAREQPGVLLYSDHIRYVEQMRRYHAAFPPEQVLVLIYEDFRADNQGTLRKVERFLGLDPGPPAEVPQANPTVRRRVGLDEKLFDVAYGRGALASAAKRTIKLVTPRRVRRGAFVAAQRRVVLAAPEPPDEELMLELRRRFKGEVHALSEYLGRDLLALWGYSDLD